MSPALPLITSSSSSSDLGDPCEKKKKKRLNRAIHHVRCKTVVLSENENNSGLKKRNVCLWRLVHGAKWEGFESRQLVLLASSERPGFLSGRITVTELSGRND